MRTSASKFTAGLENRTKSMLKCQIELIFFYVYFDFTTVHFGGNFHYIGQVGYQNWI